MSLKNLQHKQAKENTGSYNYRGIRICGATGIHEEIYKSFAELNKSKSINIIVLGSGAGAFEQRLLDNGYTDITSVEFVPEIFMVKGTKLLTIDLNKDFSNLGKYDVIFSMELMEHLENQFHFIRCVKNLMKNDSVFYLSTPNVNSTHSRIKFFLIGTLRWFGTTELYGTGHINPIFNHILNYNLSENNLKIEKHFTNKSFWVGLRQQGLRGKILCLMAFIVSLFMIHKDDFEINLYKITNK